MKIRINNIFKNKNLEWKREKKKIESVRNIRNGRNKEINFDENVYEKKYTEDNNVIVKRRRKQAIMEIPDEFNIALDYNETLDSNYYSYNEDNNSDEESHTNEDDRKNVKKYFENLVKNKNNLSKCYYFLFIAMLGLGGASVYIAGKTYNLFSKENYIEYVSSIDSMQEDTTVFSNIDDTLVQEQDQNSSNKDTNEVGDTKNKDAPSVNQVSEKSTNTNTKKNKVLEEPKIEKLSFSVPISGEVQKVFSNDKVIYSKTLDMWKTHDGIDIKANIGDKVKSIEKGTVTKIFEDSFYGITIVIDHGQGYVSYYANLSPDVSVKEKQSIVKGKVIGTISNTAIGEIKDEAHLHFCLMKDNNVVDPTYIFN